MTLGLRIFRRYTTDRVNDETNKGLRQGSQKRGPRTTIFEHYNQNPLTLVRKLAVQHFFFVLRLTSSFLQNEVREFLVESEIPGYRGMFFASSASLSQSDQ